MTISLWVVGLVFGMLTKLTHAWVSWQHNPLGLGQRQCLMLYSKFSDALMGPGCSQQLDTLRGNI
jgi:hypothetical protein